MEDTRTSAAGHGLDVTGIAAIRSAIQNRTASATTLAQEYLQRIRANDQQPGQEINSYLSLAEERALGQAAATDELARKGDPLPPLAGVPVGVKDVLTMRGAPATAGSAILKGYHPPYDASSVARLDAAGATLLGKLNCDEFAMGSSNENSAFGPVLNPRALDRVPGGSSGGSAAAVAADFCVAALGTDTGGSIRQPAAFCGVVGVLPTYGRVSRYGLIAYASSLDRVGPLAHTVEDAAILLGILAGADGNDATSAALPQEDFAAASRLPVEGIRVGVPAEYFTEGLDPEIREAVERCIQQLERAGCTVHPVSLPHTAYAVPTYYVLATAEVSSNLSRFDGVRYGHRAADAKTLSSLFRESREEGFGAEVKRRILLGTYSLSAGYYDAYYRKAQQVRTLIARDFLAAFQHVDALVTPMTPTPPWRLGEKADDPVSMYLADIYTVAASLAGICGVSVPCGTTGAGLPIGVQVLAGHFAEGKLLQVAQVIESAQIAERTGSIGK